MKKILLFYFCTTIFGANWNQFRGEGYSGIDDNKKLPITWNTKNILWKFKYDGKSGSSPITHGDKIYFTTAVAMDTGTVELSKLNNYSEIHKKKFSRQLYCVSTNGSLIWKKELDKSIPKEPIHPKNTFASETPLTDGKRVYAYFGNIGLFACDGNTGKLVWTYKVEEFPMAWDWGTSMSPTIYENKIILVNDNEKQSYIVVIDSKTGKEIWKKNREEKSSWASPLVWKTFGRIEIIALSGTGYKNKYNKLEGRVRSYDLETGKEFWNMMGMTLSTICVPFVYDNLLIISTGNNTVTNRPIYAIKAGAIGDITLASNETENRFVKWKINGKVSPHVPSPIGYNNKLFVMSDEGNFSCYDIYSSKLLYTNRFKCLFTASPIAFNGYVFFLNEWGYTYAVNADTMQIHTNVLPMGSYLSTPIINNANIIIKNSDTLYCIY